MPVAAMQDSVGLVPDRATLMRMATGYLARYAASSHRMRQVLERRIRRWCLARELEVPAQADVTAALDDVVARLEQLGLLDDRAFTAMRARALALKGLPERRIRMMLRGQGLDLDGVEDDAEPLDEATQARRYAERKRLGPFRLNARSPSRDKDLRGLLRAGFSYSVAVFTVDSDAEGNDDGDDEGVDP